LQKQQKTICSFLSIFRAEQARQAFQLKKDIIKWGDKSGFEEALPSLGVCLIVIYKGEK
jgi:hypothetical protein